MSAEVRRDGGNPPAYSLIIPQKHVPKIATLPTLPVRGTTLEIADRTKRLCLSPILSESAPKKTAPPVDEAESPTKPARGASP